jgi:hypothetical protein
VIIQKSDRKLVAYLLVGLTILIGAIHTWQPLTISSPDSSERFNASLFLVVFACLIPFGYRFARVALGWIFLFFTSVNLLIFLAYVREINSEILIGGFLTIIMGALGYLLLRSSSIRVFEENRQEQELAKS